MPLDKHPPSNDRAFGARKSRGARAHTGFERRVILSEGPAGQEPMGPTSYLPRKAPGSAGSADPFVAVDELGAIVLRLGPTSVSMPFRVCCSLCSLALRRLPRGLAGVIAQVPVISQRRSFRVASPYKFPTGHLGAELPCGQGQQSLPGTNLNSEVPKSPACDLKAGGVCRVPRRT